MFVSVIIPAAGMGSRMGAAVSKQFIELEGKPILALTVERFQECDEIDEIIIAAAADQVSAISEIVKRYALSKVAHIVVGGSIRQQSVANALAAVAPSCSIVIVHDAVRPFVRSKMIHESIAAAGAHRAAVVAVSVKDTIKQSTSKGFLGSTLDRAVLWAAQTPQTFEAHLLREAYARAGQDGITATDDASLVERLGVQPAIVRGSYDNIKITTPEDLELAALIMRRF